MPAAFAPSQPNPVSLSSPLLGAFKALRKALEQENPARVHRLAKFFLHRHPCHAGYFYEAQSQAFELEDDLQPALSHARAALDWFLGSSLPTIHRYVRLARETEALHDAQLAAKDGLRHFPDDPFLCVELGRIAYSESRFNDALAIYTPLEHSPCCAHSLELRSSILFFKAQSLFALGRHQDAEDAYVSALVLVPHFPSCWQHWVFAAHYMPHMSAESLARLPKAAYQALYANMEASTPDSLTRTKDPQQVLRIGIFSAGLRTHPVGWMAGPVLHALRQQGDVRYVMYNTGKGYEQDDDLRHFFQELADAWHDVGALSDTALYQRVLDDKLDIAIDMAGYGEGSRLGLFARRIAPVQIKWLGGMFCSSGVPAMDYLLTDAVQTPEGTEPFYTEQLVRLARGYVGYAPPPYMPEVGPSPHLDHGSVTFGCCNNAFKLSEAIIELWASILLRVPGSRLLLKSDRLHSDEQICQLKNRFARHGIEQERLLIEKRSRHAALLETYHRIDIALDPWPYTGGLSTLEALWMGVPVITTPGPSFAGRHAAGHLYHLGLKEFIASDFASYAELAVSLATHSEALVRVRTMLRPLMLNSPLLRHDLLAADLRAALRCMWERACAGLPPAAISLPPVPDPYAADQDATTMSANTDVPLAKRKRPKQGKISDADMLSVIRQLTTQAGRDVYTSCCARHADDPPLINEGIKREWQLSLERAMRAKALAQLECAYAGKTGVTSRAAKAERAAHLISTFILEIGQCDSFGVQTGDCVLDCGAKDGHFALWAGMAGAETVWALEHDPSGTNAGDKPAGSPRAALHRNAAHYNGSSPWMFHSTLPLFPDTLDAWCSAHACTPTYIHMDLGADSLPVLQGATKLLLGQVPAMPAGLPTGLPRLVIRVRQEDLYTLPVWLINLRPDCRMDCRLDAQEQLVLYIW